MTMILRLGGTAALALSLIACGGEGGGETVAEAPAAAAEKVDALQPGSYEVTTTVAALDVTDGDVAATGLKVDDVATANICVGEDGKLPAATFAEGSDNCTIDDGAYFRRSSIRQQLTCSRSGQRGTVNLQVQAKFTADSFEGDVNSGTYFAGTGDYSMTRSITGKRTGDC